MNLLDIILILALFLFFWAGFWRGLIKTIGGLIGLILGIIIAGLYYEDLASWASQFLPWSEGLFKVIAFILIYIIAARLVEFIFYLLDRVFKFIAIIPFLKTINRFAGGVLALVEGVIFLGAGLFVYSKYAFWPLFDAQIIESEVAPALIFLIKFVILLLPDALKQIEGLI